MSLTLDGAGGRVEGRAKGSGLAFNNNFLHKMQGGKTEGHGKHMLVSLNQKLTEK